MNRTNIEWVKNPDGSQGYTWNPITGCLNHDNGLCKGGNFPCYAYKLANGRLKPLYLANKNGLPYSIFEKSVAEELKAEIDAFYPRFWEERLYQLRGIGEYDKAYPARNAYNASREKDKGIFVCDMGDLFGIGIPEEWTKRVLEQIKIFSQHRFYLLTKQPQNLIKFSSFPDNCWVGVTVTNADMYLPTMEALDAIDAKVKYVSFEPLLENPSEFCEQWSEDLGATIDWLIIGAWTGSIEDKYKLKDRYPDLKAVEYGHKVTVQPKIEWVREIVEAADKAGVKVFLKDNLKPLVWGSKLFENTDLLHHLSSNVIEKPLGLRQELPE